MENNPQWKISIVTNKDSKKAIEWWLSGKTLDEYFGTTKKENGKWIKNNIKNEQAKLFQTTNSFVSHSIFSNQFKNK